MLQYEYDDSDVLWQQQTIHNPNPTHAPSPEQVQRDSNAWNDHVLHFPTPQHHTIIPLSIINTHNAVHLHFIPSLFSHSLPSVTFAFVLRDSKNLSPSFSAKHLFPLPFSPQQPPISISLFLLLLLHSISSPFPSNFHSRVCFLSYEDERRRYL